MSRLIGEVRGLHQTAGVILDCRGLDELIPRAQRETLLKRGSAAEFEEMYYRYQHTSAIAAGFA